MTVRVALVGGPMEDGLDAELARGRHDRVEP